MVCGAKLDDDICSYCGLDNSDLSNKDNERCYIILWAVLTAICIPLPLILIQPDFSGGYGGLVYVVYLMIPAMIISFIGNYVSYKRKLHL